ncbi:hypothetical protein VP03_13510 [Sinorhizobium meliloti]|nr:hypothetical protein VP03_13510 [Sinorhizobium meliloti]
MSPRPHLCACHRDEGSAASAARGMFFQPKDLAWLDPCDEHRDEEVKPILIHRCTGERRR